VKVTFDMMAQGIKGNQRAPMIAENGRGERIYTYRGNDRYAHYLYYKNGTWARSGRIPGSPLFEDYWYSDIVADSTGKFHYVCEEADHSMFYAYFQNGAWAPMRKIDMRHEATLALGVRSDDTIVLVAPAIVMHPKGVTKDVFIATKPKGKNSFSGIKNITNDHEPSTMVDVAIDANDNSWISYKGAFFSPAGETMQTVLLKLNKNNKEVYFKNVSGQDAAWCWYSRIAVNTDGQVMVTWMLSQQRTYFYRLYDSAKNKWNEVKELAPGTVNPWPYMYNKLLARGTDFFWIGLNSDRLLSLYKYDAAKDTWDKLADVSKGGANWFEACNGADSILISWESQSSPASCYLTTVTGVPVKPQFSNISGTVKQDSKGLSGVTLTGLPEDPTTDSSGNYSVSVEPGWTGSVIPYKSGYRFEPPSREYLKITTGQTGQDYSAIAQFNLTIGAASGGTTTPPPATYPKDKNSLVTVRANPSSSYRFANWTGDASGSANPITLTIDKNKTIRANFIEQFDLMLSATSGGTTTPPPATYTKDKNTLLTVTAVPDLNYRFANWTGDAPGAGNPLTLKFDKKRTIRANFIRIKSVANLQVEKRVERSLFSGYTLNVLTWEANPQNAAMGLAVSAQRVYRKARTEDNTKWARLVELAGAVLSYEDRNVPEDSDYVYAVTCVDDKGNESAVY
jgi:hypothetical protein